MSTKTIEINTSGATGVVPTPNIVTNLQELLTAVKLTGYGEEAIPDPTLFKRIDDYNTAVETLQLVLAKILGDNTSASEVCAKFIQPNKVDMVGVSELLTFIWNILPLWLDNVAPTDLLQFTWNSIRSYSDSTQAVEYKVANLQTYFQADYVQPGYVGTNITL